MIPDSPPRRHDNGLPWLLWFTIVTGLAAAIVFLISQFYESRSETSQVGSIRVVSRTEPPVRDLLVPNLDSPRAVPSDDRNDIIALQQALSARFPSLKDAEIVCERVCSMMVHGSAMTEANLDPLQLPYMGRLENFLRSHGFEPIDNLMIEEAGDGEFVLRLSFLSTALRPNTDRTAYSDQTFKR